MFKWIIGTLGHTNSCSSRNAEDSYFFSNMLFLELDYLANFLCEGANYKEYAPALSPSTAAMTKSDKLALKFFDFELVDVLKKLALHVPKTKQEEKAKQVSESLVSLSHISDVINAS
jgi:hypothetical protein